MRSSAIFFVSVVTRMRCSFSTRVRISAIRSSICPRVGRTITSGRPDRSAGRSAATTAFALLDLVRARRRRHEHDLVDALDELLEAQRTVVHRGRQPEPVLDERLLARPVALVHPVQLRHGDVRLVDEDQEVLREVVEQRVGGLAGLASVDVPRVVLDARARADLAHHLEVVVRAHAQPLRLEELVLRTRARRAARRARPRSRRIALLHASRRTRRSGSPGRCAGRRAVRGPRR